MTKTRGWLLVGVLAVIIVGVYFADQSQSSPPYTVYPVFCEDWGNNPPAVEDFANCQKLYAYPRETFTLDESKNQITEISPDSSSFYVLNNCTIVDTEHWECRGNNDFFGEVSPSRNGDNFSENADDGGPFNTIFATQAQWDSINNGLPSLPQGS